MTKINYIKKTIFSYYSYPDIIRYFNCSMYGVIRLYKDVSYYSMTGSKNQLIWAMPYMPFDASKIFTNLKNYGQN